MKTQLKVGIFVTIIALIAGYLIITFGNKNFGVATKYYYVYFDDAGGLSKGADVQVRGVKAGMVDDITFENSKVKVKFSINKDIPIYKDAKIYIRTYGLMGDKYIYVDPGNPSAGELAEGNVIQNVQMVATTEDTMQAVKEAANKFGNLSETLNQATGDDRLKKLLEDFDRFAATTADTVSENRENIKASIENIKAITASLRETLPPLIAKIDKTVDNVEKITSENREDIRALIANLKETSAALKEKTPKVLDSVEKAANQVDVVLSENRGDIKVSIEQLRESTKQLHEILAKVNEGRGTLGKLVNDDSLYNNTNEGVKSFAKPFKIVNDSRLDIQMYGEKHTGNKDSKAGFGAAFIPSDDRYYYVGILSNSNGTVSKKEEVTAGGTTTTYVTKSYGILFDLQYARRLLTFGATQFWIRAGIKDSSADIGADLVLSDNLKLYSDLYRFNRKDLVNQPNNPQLDIGFQYKFGDTPFFIRAGGSDLANRSVRGFYIGGGLLFTDDYLKYLFSSIPIRR
ncbi:hypothetical protein JCM14244_06130 [Venenivibrio stagnispumantis]|uniref:Phospholipid/cholesterol/gamma-HCH transport system substrate-binding protein n=1 Tax=Venenivibrio stagnispumantis TaxID=407998 RepID=A0AA45WID2_9AQUI|nr:MlaD family protein [Venenivibrio stagnispumantis]MCW4572557.1 MCE family protein [Venenivibrio stagnispumantis]SMP00349.1 phospholipid/cholesterol/gamma-HCH transport system substrate-binding protein [Venenivibrio stagnispumantis]